MNENKGLHLLYKKLGETPHETILRFKKENPQFETIKITYAGRLDPMAEGLLLVLSGENLQKKDEYLGLPKTYEFKVLWGFETDTLDILGKVGKYDLKEVTLDVLKSKLAENIGKFKQKYPAYSSRPVNGKPMFVWAREGRLSEIEIPSHEVEIFDLKHLKRKKVDKNDLLKQIKNDISLVKGDFRQDEIIKKWDEILLKIKEDIFTVDSFEIKVSSGFYVRQFVLDFAKKLETLGITLHIKRTKIGEFELG